MDINHPVDLYDALVIGGGPAGLSAAIYLARACRSVAVIDCDRPGRSDWAQVNHNYLGFPEGISIVELCTRGREQAERFGASLHQTEVASLTQEEGLFKACGPGLVLHGRAVVLATGVTDRWAEFPGYEEYIGRTMHWCIVCDGYEMQAQRVVVVGNDKNAAEMAMQMLGYTDHVILLTNSGALGLPQTTVRALDARGIRLVVGRIASARAKELGVFEVLHIEGGTEIELDHLFSAQGAEPNTALARALGVELTTNGYIKVDVEAKTSVPGVFAAGDVTRLFSHQVLTAAHEGATAATAVDYYLFQLDQNAFQVGRARPE
ncbi:MAG: thioredoxin reductase [Thermomicrobiales bacterium]|jgi:thioredoxin reductase (NADPH)|nr:thioredoxin reductase [Thermomicrobiales bacterium]MEA2585946.1 thioredoxin reductase [Thermomicrobiales bacterium]